ncbi:MAG: alpha/beta hydrolase [Proteobacteria bacterium]|nr:alpha/beta hydrolase [Pseudomonadota bacterium]
MKHHRFPRLAPLLLALLLVILSVPCRGNEFSKPPVNQAPVNGISLGYRVLGQGPPLLLITGYGATMDVWDPTLVERLALSFQVIAFDNRGMGTSSASETSFSYALFASDALGLLDYLRIPSAHVLGWSMGSCIAQELALKAPHRTGKLILYASAPDSTEIVKVLDRLGTLKPEELMGMMFPKPWLDGHPGIFERLPAPAQAPDPAIIARQRKAIEQWTGTRERLGTLHKDTLLLVGEEDFITPPAHSLALAGLIPGAWLVKFRQGGHWLMYQSPERMARIITSFLKTNPDQGEPQPPTAQ